MSITIIQGVVFFWSGLLAWILGEYLFARFQNLAHNTSKKQDGTRKKRILWFTDTINDLNGVAVTLKNIGWLAHNRGDEIYLVSSILQSEHSDDIPPNLINLKPVFHFPIPYYPTMRAKVPGLLSSMLRLMKYKPDEVFISSPTFVGTWGLIFSKLFGIRSTAVYHTDYTKIALQVIGRVSIHVKFIEFYTKWFHILADRILVPSSEYINILEKRGLPRERMEIFSRGINTDLFKPVRSAKKKLYEEYGIPEGINLLYSGRISEDKKMNFLLESVLPVLKKRPNVNLILAGYGPMVPELKERLKDYSQIHFTGHVDNKKTPLLYSAADLLVFPSEIDTFGMAVLESLACGTPAIVSHIGGPRTIVCDQYNGYMVPTDSSSAWREKIDLLCDWIGSENAQYKRLRTNARSHVLKNYDFEKILDNYLAGEREIKQKTAVVSVNE